MYLLKNRVVILVSDLSLPFRDDFKVYGNAHLKLWSLF